MGGIFRYAIETAGFLVPGGLVGKLWRGRRRL